MRFLFVTLFLIVSGFQFSSAIAECAGMHLDCQSIRDYDQCVNKQYGCTWFSGGGIDGCYGNANKCNTIGTKEGCEGHNYCSWFDELHAEKKVVPPTLDQALQIISLAKTIPSPTNSSETIKLTSNSGQEMTLTMEDIKAAKAVLNENDILLNNGKCCKKGAGPIPDRTDACYLWDNKFCYVSPTSGQCSAASDACPSAISPSALVPCNP